MAQLVDFDDLTADELSLGLVHVEHGVVDGEDGLVDAGVGGGAPPTDQGEVAAELEDVIVACLQARELMEYPAQDMHYSSLHAPQ
jgi:hypothetical protein